MNEPKKNILIVEDEFSIAMDIEMRLQKMNYNVCATACNYQEALNMLLENDIDLVLLDINLKSEKTGIDIGKIISQKFNIPIVFLTAYTDQKTFADTLEANPAGFITKPFKDADLNNNIQLALINFSKELAKKQELKIENNSIFVKDKGTLYQIHFDDIYWLQAMDNYTILHDKSKKYIVNSYLKDVINVLGNNFIRIHKSHAVAINKISTIKDSILYIGNYQLIISKNYKNQLLEKLKII